MQNQSSELVIHRTINASLDKVWHAWTDAKIISKWYSANPALTLKALEFDARTGGGFRFIFVDKDGKIIPGEYTAKFIRVMPQSEITFSVADNTITDGAENATAKFTAKFTEDSDKTKMTCIGNLPDDVDTEMTREAWNKCFDNLTYYLDVAKL